MIHKFGDVGMVYEKQNKVNGRRYTDPVNTARIEKLQSDFIASTDRMFSEMQLLTREVAELSKQMQKANEGGLQEILQSHRDSNGFSAVSVKFGKILLGIAAVGSAIAVIVGFGASFIMGLMQGK